MDKIIRLLIYLFATVLVSCKQDAFEKIPETTVTGTIKEGNFRTPIRGAKIYVWQYGKTTDLVKSQIFREKLIDSAITNDFGIYTISFKSTINANSYKIDFKLNEGFYYEYPLKEIQRGVNNNLDLLAYQTCILKASITSSINKASHLNVHTNSEINRSWTLSSYKLDRVASDTALFLKLIPNKENYITFSFYDGNIPYFYSELIKPAASLDTLVRSFNLDLKDFKR